MQVDIVGKVNNVKIFKKDALLPLFEAVVNSIQSIEEKETEDGLIKVKIIRDEEQQVLEDKEDNSFRAVKEIIIEDNGVGFNDANFRSFQLADSTYKFQKGAKGNGRFVWLKTFDEVMVRSAYLDVDKEIKIRDFNFVLDQEPIKMIESSRDSQVTRTKVHLKGLKDHFVDGIPKKLETIAMRIIEHCMAYLVSSYCPEITIEDDEDKISINELFKEKVILSTEEETFQIKGNYFNLMHVKSLKADGNENRIHFCGNQRTVEDKKLETWITALENRLELEDNRKFFYSAYVSGDILDKSVNLERTGFNISQNEVDLLNEITMADIRNEAIKYIKKYLKVYIEPLNKKKIEVISDYIHYQSPQYKPLLKYKPEKLESIALSSLEPSKLEIELFKITQEFNLEVKKEGDRLLSQRIDDIKNIDEYKHQYASYIEKENISGVTSLAQYVVHRKVILKLLEAGIKAKNGKYEKEEYIHKLIFPMRAESEDIGYEQHNLWLIDEKLSYHYYLASDMSMKKNKHLKGLDDLDRPDLIIFDRPLVMVNQEENPYQSIVIVEFKRPMRADYDDESNPITQVYDYVKKIRSGTELDKDGRPIRATANTPIYLYVICDLTPSMMNNAENFNLHPTPDGEGFFGYNNTPKVNAYIEVISFDKLLNDARKRNKILFDKLFYPEDK